MIRLDADEFCMLVPSAGSVQLSLTIRFSRKTRIFVEKRKKNKGDFVHCGVKHADELKGTNFLPTFQSSHSLSLTGSEIDNADLTEVCTDQENPDVGCAGRNLRYYGSKVSRGF